MIGIGPLSIGSGSRGRWPNGGGGGLAFVLILLVAPLVIVWPKHEAEQAQEAEAERRAQETVQARRMEVRERLRAVLKDVAKCYPGRADSRLVERRFDRAVDFGKQLLWKERQLAA